MVLQLALGGSAATPSSQIGINWQGVRPGDELTAEWADELGLQNWSGGTPLGWIRRDAYGTGERWQLDLERVPATMSTISLVMSSPTARAVGIAVAPLSGSADDAVLHPGLQVAGDEVTVVLELRRSTAGWQVVAKNTVRPSEPPGHTGPHPPGQTGPHPTGPTGPHPTGPAGQTGPHPPDPDGGRPTVAVVIPDHLRAAVDRVRSSGAARHHARVSVVLDLSASMRPWLVNGVLADTLTAIQAVTCASSRPSMSVRLVPDGAATEIDIADSTDDMLKGFLARTGLRTGAARALHSQAAAAAGRGGLVFVITDDPFAAARMGSDAIAVFLGSAAVPTERLVVVGESVDVGMLARELAVAAAAGSGAE